MSLQDLVQALRESDAYPHPVEGVEVIHTHVSIVLLAGAFAYKIKKPVAFGFLDFTTLDRRLHFCREEVRLNRRLAPGIYVGVEPIVAGAEGYRIGGAGKPVEYAVKMRRLPSGATMLAHLERGELTPEMIERVARRTADFHRDAPGGPRAAYHGRWRTVARTALGNCREARDQRGRLVSAAVFDRAYAGVRAALRRHRRTIESRARRGVPREIHGDLRLEHVYFLPVRDPPEDLVVIDCVEFGDRFRCGDPVSDFAFLAMDLAFRGRRDLARHLGRTYFEARPDPEGERLLPFYLAFRALVRAKVEGLIAEGREIPETRRREAAGEARGRWLFALGELEGPNARPGLVLVAGLPGTGKSTLAHDLAQAAGFEVLSSDRTRKGLAGLDEAEPAPAPYRSGLYTPEWTHRVYTTLLEETGRRLLEGGRVIVDASFRDEGWRARFLDLARSLGIRQIFLVCTAEPWLVRRRLEGRAPGSSDADWEVHQALAQEWQAPSSRTAAAMRTLDTGIDRTEVAVAALRELAGAGLTRPRRSGARPS